MNLSFIQSRIQQLSVERQGVIQELKREKKALAKSYNHYSHTLEAQKLGQRIAQTVQQNAHNHIASIVSDCLRTVFGSDYQFKISFQQRRGKTEADLVLLKNGHEVGDPIDGDSGGVLDVAGFALRISNLLLSKPRLSPVLIIDEPFKNVHSPVYRRRVRTMIEELSRRMGIQIIMVTGETDLQIGKIIQLQKNSMSLLSP